MNKYLVLFSTKEDRDFIEESKTMQVFTASSDKEALLAIFDNHCFVLSGDLLTEFLAYTEKEIINKIRNFDLAEFFGMDAKDGDLFGEYDDDDDIYLIVNLTTGEILFKHDVITDKGDQSESYTAFPVLKKEVEDH